MIMEGGARADMGPDIITDAIAIDEHVFVRKLTGKINNKNCCMLYISNYIVRLSLLKLVFYASFFYFANIFILKRCPCQSRPNVQSRTA